MHAGERSPAPRRKRKGYSVRKKMTEIVWFPLSSTARISSSYSVSGAKNSAGTESEVASAGRRTLYSNCGSSSLVTMIW
jgi:hypothetical protein